MAHLYHVSSEDLNVVTFFDSKIESICSQVVMERLRDTYIYIYRYMFKCKIPIFGLLFASAPMARI